MDDQAPATPEPSQVQDQSKPDEKAAKEGQALSATQKQRLKLNLKVDGQETQEELDEDQIRREIQLGRAATKRFQEAAEIRKKDEALFAKLRDKNGLIEVIKEAGYNPRELAEEFLTNELNYELMTPEQKRIYELEKEIFERTQREKARDQETLTAKEKEATERLTKEFNTKIIAALEASNLPKTPESVSMMARVMRLHLERGIDLDPMDAAAMVEDEIRGYGASTLAKMSVNKLKEVLGQETVNALLKDSLAQVKDPVVRNKPSNGEFPKFNKPKKTYRTESEFEKHMRQIRGER